MTQKRFTGLLEDIKQEKKEIEDLLTEIQGLIPSDNKTPNKVVLRAMGSILHDFYTGIEKMFRRIALEMEGTLPEGENWHRQLLNRMSGEIESTRPAVISNDLKNTLDEYLRFRHLFRHLYGFELKWSRCRNLVENMDQTFMELNVELKEFENFLSELNNQLEE